MPYVLLGRTNGPLYWDLGSLKGRRLALAKRHPLIPSIETLFPQIRLTETANGQEAIELLATGRVDAAVDVKLFANQFINGDYAGQIRSLGQIDDLPGSFSMAVPKRLAGLVPLLDSSLETVTTSERESALRRWVAVDLEPVPEEDDLMESEHHIGGNIEHHGRVDVSNDMTRHDDERLRQLIENHQRYTNSTRAEEILADWDSYPEKFVKVMPTEYRRALQEIEEAQLASIVAAE